MSVECGVRESVSGVGVGGSCEHEAGFSSELLSLSEEWLSVVGSVSQIQVICESVGLDATVPFHQRDINQAVRWYIEERVHGGELLLRLADGVRTQDVLEQLDALIFQDKQVVEDQMAVVFSAVENLYHGLSRDFYETILGSLVPHAKNAQKRAEDISFHEMQRCFGEFTRCTSFVAELINKVRVDFDTLRTRLDPCDIDAISTAIDIQIACMDRVDTPAIRCELNDFAQRPVSSATKRAIEAYWIHTSNGVISGGPGFVYHDFPFEDVPPVLEAVVCIQTGLEELADLRSPQLLIRNVFRPVMLALRQEEWALRLQAGLTDEQLVDQLIATMTQEQIYATIAQAVQEEAVGDLVGQAEQLEQLYLLFTRLEAVLDLSCSDRLDGEGLAGTFEDQGLPTITWEDLREMPPEEVLATLREVLGEQADLDFLADAVALNYMEIFYHLFQLFPFPRTPEDVAKVRDGSFALRQEATRRSLSAVLGAQGEYPKQEVDAVLRQTLATKVRQDLVLRADNLTKNFQVFKEAVSRLRTQFQDTMLPLARPQSRERQARFSRASVQAVSR